jgi:phosphopantetheinyl transferase (holo-ACP synthase)
MILYVYKYDENRGGSHTEQDAQNRLTGGGRAADASAAEQASDAERASGTDRDAGAEQASCTEQAPGAENRTRAGEAARDRESPNALFRTALRDYVAGLRPPVTVRDADIRFAYNAHGKPYFAAPSLSPICFSISHSGQYWAVLFHDAPVGLDIEDVSKNGRRTAYDKTRFRRIAARFFAPPERDLLLDSEDEQEVKTRFFQIWTRKEAYMKYTGNGFAEIPERFSVIEPSAQNGEVPHDGASQNDCVPYKSSRENDLPANKQQVFDESGEAIPCACIFDVPIEVGICCACCCDEGTEAAATVIMLKSM